MLTLAQYLCALQKPFVRAKTLPAKGGGNPDIAFSITLNMAKCIRIHIDYLEEYKIMLLYD